MKEHTSKKTLVIAGFLLLVGIVAITNRPTSPGKLRFVAQREPVEGGRELRWIYQTVADPMGRGDVKLASVRSTNEVEFDFPYNGKQRVTLQLRDHPGLGKDVLLQLDKGQFLCHDKCNVNIRFDEGRVQAYGARGPVDNSTTLLFLENYSQFVQNAIKAKNVSIAALIYQEGQPAFHFNIEGLKWP